jgi:hypothetical protein
MTHSAIVSYSCSLREIVPDLRCCRASSIFERTLLNKGLKYNLYSKNKNWIETLVLEAETAINNLEITTKLL